MFVLELVFVPGFPVYSILYHIRPTERNPRMPYNRYIQTSTARITADVLERFHAYAGDIHQIGAELGRVCSSFTYDKDDGAVYDHLLALICCTIYYTEYTPEYVMQEIAVRRIAAHAKHGDNSIEAKNATDTLFWLACLGEEFGELCETINYDDMVQEAFDVITVATAWASAFNRIAS